MLFARITGVLFSLIQGNYYHKALLQERFFAHIVDFYALFYYNIQRESQEGGDNMSGTGTVLELAKQNNGIVTAAMVGKAGISRGILKYLSDTGRLERASRGVYTLPEAWEDEFVSVQNRFKRGVYSLETALFLCDLTDRTPDRFHMTFPSTYNLSGPKREGIICSGSTEPLYRLGIVELTTPGGNTVMGYCAERSLCDILKTRYHTDIQVVANAFKTYVSWRNKNIPRLSEYARKLRVEKALRAYLEVLL